MVSGVVSFRQWEIARQDTYTTRTEKIAGIINSPRHAAYCRPVFIKPPLTLANRVNARLPSTMNNQDLIIRNAAHLR
jgi:hypothetical protein